MANLEELKAAYRDQFTRFNADAVIAELERLLDEAQRLCAECGKGFLETDWAEERKALEAQLSASEALSEKRQRACEAVLAKIDWQATTRHPITQNLNYLGYGEDVREMTQQLRAAIGGVKCPRCGADFLPHGQCSRHLQGCQDGVGEAIGGTNG